MSTHLGEILDWFQISRVMHAQKFQSTENPINLHTENLLCTKNTIDSIDNLILTRKERARAIKIEFNYQSLGGTDIAQLFRLIRKLNEVYEETKNVEASWVYCDNYILETGLDLSDLSSFQMNMVKSECNNKSSVQKQSKKGDFSGLYLSNKGEHLEYRKRFLIRSYESFFCLPIEKIAFFYDLKSVTMAVDFDGREYPIDFLLDSLEKQLDPKVFFQVNMKTIINIQSIKMVHTSANSNFKLEIHPLHSEDILLDQHKMASFKRWLDR